MTLHDLVVDAGGRLSRAGIPDSEARLDAELLARRVLGWDRARFLTDRHAEAPSGFGDEYEDLIVRREGREPISYILKSKEFWGLEFELSEDVLIPRPETELLIEEALLCGRTLRASNARPLVVDAGTGSGCIAVALARNFPQARVIATDISQKALDVARRNAARHGVAERVDFVRTNFLAAIRGQLDLIVSNPPYVPHRHLSTLAPEIREFEPHVALFGGGDGLEQYSALFDQAAERLASSGHLLVEFGDGQEKALDQMIARRPCLQVMRVRHDLQGLPRTMAITRRKLE